MSRSKATAKPDIELGSKGASLAHGEEITAEGGSFRIRKPQVIGEVAADAGNKIRTDDGGLAIPEKGLGKISLFESPRKLLLLMAAAVAASEVVIMLLLPRFLTIAPVPLALVDAVFLLFLFPFFYYLWFRPFQHQVQRRRRLEEVVQHLSRQLLAAGEEERKKLASDLHDEFGQAITAMRLDLEALLRAEGGCSHLADRLLGRITQMHERLRHISSALRPQLLDELGVVPALELHLREIADISPHLTVLFKTTGLKERLPGQVEIALYRIGQEAVNNVLRHARAKSLQVLLTYSCPMVILNIRDDGEGFDPELAARVSGGIGLSGIRERAAALGGTVRIASAPGRGTVLRVELPVATEGCRDSDQNPAG